MKAHLMHRSGDFDLKRASPLNEGILSKDLEIETLFSAMANNDQLIYYVAKKAILTGGDNDLSTIVYRQDALKDAIRHPAVIRQIYTLAEEAFQRQKKVWPRFREYPSGRLDSAVEVMGIYVDVLRRLRALAVEQAPEFESEAFSNLFSMLGRELSDDYFEIIERHLRRLKFRGGVLVSAGLGQGFKGANYVLRRSPQADDDWLTRLSRLFTENRVSQFLTDGPRSYTLYLAPRDEAGAQAISELRDRGLGLAANALAKSAEHIASFFRMLRTEIAFYVGCLNLHEKLLELKAPFTFPSATDSGLPRFSCRQLHDVCLALTMKACPVGNDVAADGKALIIVTGPNQGGKTTFLRSFGLAQLAMQSGMFVAAEYFEANIVDGVFSHFKHEEDATMKSGKFDEELSRMNDIVAILPERALLLFNESFSATNEREGSEIARQIVTALLERPHKIVFVTHQFAFAHGLFERRLETALFLRAERRDDGRRTFKLTENEPLATSFGEDVYCEVFLADGGARFEGRNAAGAHID